MIRAPGTARATRLALLLVLAAQMLSSLYGCGAASPHRASSAAAAANGAEASAGPAFGLTEDNAALLWSADQPPLAQNAAASDASLAAQGRAGRVQLARAQLSALHPAYVRLLIDWAALQPDPRRAPALEAQVSGCARTIRPCASYRGVRDELAAVASQQRAAGRAAFQVVIDIFGTPAWAAQPASGCEQGGLGTFSRAPSAAGLSAYRELVHALIALGTREGVALDWWAPWNEPNDPTFLSPQRASCSTGAAALSASSYARLAQAMAAQLRAEGGRRHLLLGELNAYQSGAADRTSVAQFVGALPADTLCVGDVWSLHAYAGWGRTPRVHDPVTALETALGARGGCARGAPVWVTEAGAGAPHAGEPRRLGAPAAQAGCDALALQLQRWSSDPRVGAIFQYTFRDDPAFPVGLIDAQLSHTYPEYRLWLAWSRVRSAEGGPGALADACAR
jgi:hypothetical protein